MKLSVLISILIVTTCAWADQTNPKVDPNLERKKDGAGFAADPANTPNPGTLKPLDNAGEKLILDWSKLSLQMRKQYKEFGMLPGDDQIDLSLAELAAQQINEGREKQIQFKTSTAGGIATPSFTVYSKQTAKGVETVKVLPSRNGAKLQIRKSFTGQ